MHNAGLSRAWGDGAGNNKPHIIEDISFFEGNIDCKCGTIVYRAVGLTLEDAWDIHRGRADLVADRALTPSAEARASDAEVSDFLTLISDYPDLEFEAAA